MSILSEENIDFIVKKVNESNIKSSEMKEDLIDHFCCAIEEEMKKGLTFEKSYDKAYQNICPPDGGFDEIQRETVFLLTFKKIKAMKRLMYVSGYLSAIGITTTVFMKLSHLAGGQIALLLTSAILAFLFLPALFINLYKRELTKSISDKLKYMSGLLGVVLLVAFAVFKFSHWPGTTIIFLTSVVIINFVCFPFLFFKMYRKSI
jgi:cation transport ATPase